MSPWLITTTGWPGLGARVALAILRAGVQPATVAAASAVAAVLGSVALVKLSARARAGRPESPS